MKYYRQADGYLLAATDEVLEKLIADGAKLLEPNSAEVKKYFAEVKPPKM